MKQYVKPQITLINIIPNQAIATCAITVNPKTIKYIGYDTEWDGRRNGIIYSTKSEAEKANRGPVCICYDILREDKSRIFLGKIIT